MPSRHTFGEKIEEYSTSQSEDLLAHLAASAKPEVLARLTGVCGELAGEAAQIDLTDGLRITFKDGDIIHLPPSGNAPELRCYTGSGTADRAESPNAAVLATIGDGELAG